MKKESEQMKSLPNSSRFYCAILFTIRYGKAHQQTVSQIVNPHPQARPILIFLVLHCFNDEMRLLIFLTAALCRGQFSSTPTLPYCASAHPLLESSLAYKSVPRPRRPQISSPLVWTPETHPLVRSWGGGAASTHPDDGSWTFSYSIHLWAAAEQSFRNSEHQQVRNVMSESSLSNHNQGFDCWLLIVWCTLLRMR